MKSPANTAQSWKKKAFILMASAWTMMATNYGLQYYEQNAPKWAREREKKEAKAKFVKDYDASAVKSQAVFLLPPPNKADSAQQPRIYAIRDAFVENGTPAFVLGDTAGNATLESIQAQVCDIQNRYHFKAATMLSLTHGCVYDLKSGASYTENSKIKSSEAWFKHREQTGHLSEISGGNYEPATKELMSVVAQAAQMEKLDWVSYECFSGAIRQQEVDVLPCGSMFVAMSAGNQVGYFNAAKRILEALKTKTIDVRQGVNASDFLVESLMGNWRRYNADVIVGVSGNSELAEIASDNKYNAGLDSLGGTASNAQQFERMKHLKLKKPRPPAR